MNYTKGKWSFHYFSRGLHILSTNHEDNTAKTIAKVNDEIDGDEMQANAKLMVAAPELLEALKDLRLIARNGIDDNFQSLKVLVDIEKVSNKAIKKVLMK